MANEWRGLTTAERKVLWNQTKKPSEYAVLIEQKLKEKNAIPEGPGQYSSPNTSGIHPTLHCEYAEANALESDNQ